MSQEEVDASDNFTNSTLRQTRDLSQKQKYSLDANGASDDSRSVSKMSAIIMRSKDQKQTKFITSPRRSKIRAILKTKDQQSIPKSNKRASINEQ